MKRFLLFYGVSVALIWFLAEIAPDIEKREPIRLAAGCPFVVGDGKADDTLAVQCAIDQGATIDLPPRRSFLVMRLYLPASAVSQPE